MGVPRSRFSVNRSRANAIEMPRFW